ncbi:MAG: hypothetical protein NZ551_00825 [Microscillaceae bacterium]|nr:hypothetical protein [Microscillaceae bacterium]MDW8459732.1 hypothetical protein [Cytophagales bacterium]
MQKGNKWIAVNGLKVIDKLFFEQDYWIYFVLIPVVATKGLPFIQNQIEIDKNKFDYLQSLKELMFSVKNLSKQTKLQLTLKINVPLAEPMKKLTKKVLEGENIWEDAIKFGKVKKTGKACIFL